MASQVSAPVKILALVGVLAALAMGAWMMTAGRAPTEEAADVALTPVKQIPKAQAAAGALNEHNAATAQGVSRKKAAAAKAAKNAPAAKTAAKATPVAAAKPVEKPDAGTPTTIAGLLKQHDVVVVLLYDPQARVDDYSLAEAALGAENAGAGFLRVNVLDQRQALPFTNAYGVLQDPTVLFFKRPGKLVLKLTGFADHETVAQAAHNAALGLGTVTSS